MSKRKEYDEYKPTSIMGINKIPSHWVESKFRYVTDVLTDYTANGSFKSLADNVEYLSEPDYARLIRLTDLRSNLSNDGIYVNEDSYNFLKKSALFGGEYLIANVGAYAGLVVQMPKYDGVATLGPNMMMARFDEKKVLVKFMVYISNSEYIQKQLLLKATASSAQPKLNKEDFRSVEFIYPKIDEQKCIIRYLDNKVGQIDKLIDEKKKLVLLLEEKRQAVIKEAVTKGLNPNVKMKDSGVEWIGEIPEHWEVKQLKRALKVCNGREIEIELEKNDENGINVYGSGGIFKKTDRHLFSGESVLFGRKGTIGKPMYVNDLFWAVDTMYFTKFNSNSYPKWFYYMLKVYPWDLIMTQTALPSIVGTDVENDIWAIPDYKEQIEIANYLQIKDIKMFSTIESIENQIQKLKEYRQSLIYEAVTGKIDVRDFEIEQ
ncbi:restriction endonuclease subunit S [Metabacillus elymi]|uniref:Restriction endonuclease subunit S n=1 Tax=Metabacillus elymi TaxID=2745198 RepID=A0ABX6S9Q4_9BACI|nr:restriction endonuclease subunit S [Metabacillus sp. KUDC1714]QNF28526.1 restriction endonuclease subunit S [Metabacillus sp. KUDC1714]